MTFSVTLPTPFDSATEDLWGGIINAAITSITSEQNTKTTALNAADFVLQRPNLKDYAETITNPSSASNVLTLNIENGNHFHTTLTENVTTLTISNPPATGNLGIVTIEFIQDGTGGRTVAWPASFTWASGSAPTVTSAAGSVDIVVARTRDGGTTWRAVINQDFS